MLRPSLTPKGRRSTHGNGPPVDRRAIPLRVIGDPEKIMERTSRNPQGQDMSKPIQVLVIEDNRLVREGLAALLAEQEDFTVVAAAESANVGLRLVRDMKPAVVLVDGALGSQSSHRLVQAVRESSPDTRVIVMDLLPAQQ